MVYLDGEFVEATVINTAAHRYLGMFRPPVNPTANATANIVCMCGVHLKYIHEGNQHYRAGCFDVPQYVTIK